MSFAVSKATATTEPIVVARDLGFTEGPLWTLDDELWVASVSRGLIYNVRPDEKPATVVAETGGNPTGLCQRFDRTVWVAQAGRHIRTRSTRATGPSIQWVRDGQVSDIASDQMDTPSDCVIGPDGLVWFTDPRGEALAAAGLPGAVRTYNPDTGALVTQALDIAYPNGLVFLADGSALLVAETRTGNILQFGYRGGALEFQRICAHLRGGHPDGLALDAAGNLYVAGADSRKVHIIDPSGSELASISLDERSFPTSCCFGGRDLRTLFVTDAAGGRVWAVPRDIPGARMQWDASRASAQ